MFSLSRLLCLFVVAGTAIMTAEGNVTPQGWFSVGNHLRYKVLWTPSDWNTARESCRRIGGALAHLGMKDFGFRVAIGNIMLARSSFWIGMSDQEQEGNWMWEDDSPALNSEAHWRNGEPSNGHSEDCAEIRYDQDFKSNDISCASELPALCEAYDFH